MDVDTNIFGNQRFLREGMLSKLLIQNNLNLNTNVIPIIIADEIKPCRSNVTTL